MELNRSAGILLHPTSLPGPYGIGDLGDGAYGWVDFLYSTNCSLWQILPLGPTGFGDSPYQCFSAMAGNPYLISPDILLKDGLLHSDDLVNLPEFLDHEVDFGKAIPFKLGILDRSFHQFQHSAPKEIKIEFEEFFSDQEEWLDDYALFMAIKEANGGVQWTKWESGLRNRVPSALKTAREKLNIAIQRQVYRQFLFFKQWKELKGYANGKGITIIGDAPIFVSHDSVDVWVNRDLFFLDESGEPAYVAGVPPDYFSPTGQLWGNPLYNWDNHKRTGYKWWVARLKNVLSLVDIIRLDHFRGFAGYWEIPGNAKTAEKGRWVKAPGINFFKSIQQELGGLPIIAEDLGVITPDVEYIRDHFDLPGMKILQFAFEGKPSDPFLPHNYRWNCVVYTGTHDNDTAAGWFERVDESAKKFCCNYLNCDGSEIAMDMVRACWGSVAVFSIAPMQDFLGLGNEARMNYPGNPSGNWRWRITTDLEDEQLVEKIRNLNYLFDRENPHKSNSDSKILSN